MSRRILITGGSGLLALNWALTVRAGFAVTLGLHERNITLAGVETRKLEFDSVENLLRVLEATQAQIVIHTAGLTSVEKCEADPGRARHINVDIASNVAEACARLGLPLVHISTDHLFSGQASFASESCAPEPVNVYGLTKAEAESRVLDAHPLALVVRTNFYGWGTSYRQSFSDVIIETLRAGRELTLFDDVFYTPILTEAAALVVHELIDRQASGIFNVVGDERISKHEFGLKLAQEFKLDARLIRPGSIKARAALTRRPHDMSLSNQKTCGLLGRKLGGVEAQIARLHQQEHDGLARELHGL